MSSILLISIISFFALIFLGVPIAFSMGAGSLLYMTSQGLELSVAAQKFFTQTQSFSFLAVPFFILAGTLMVEAGVAKKLIDFASVLVRHLPAGLGCVSVVTSMVLAGISGSSVADASSVGAILIPEMDDRGYDPQFSAAINATSSVVGIIIPPSSTMIVIASITNLSVAALFAAGVIPGIIIGLVYLAITAYTGVVRHYPREKRASRSEIWHATKEAFLALLFPLFMIGSIVTGMATCTESASICAVYTLVTIDSVKNIKGGIENRDLYVGVGTVLTTEQVLMAKEAGADFIITPTVNTNVIKLAKELGMMTMPGGYTPTELQNAWEAGADFVKIFPASDAGADYFHAVSGPLPHIPLVAVGGITLQNMCDFLKNGAVGIGVGGNLVDKRMISECRYDELTKLAHEYVKQLGDEQ